MRLLRLLSFFLVFSFVISLLFAKRVSAQACTPISKAPDLYQINRVSNQATLYITPVSGQVKSYTIIYGLSEGDERYSTTFNYGSSTGAITYTVDNLDPKLVYYFKVRANNSCSNSPFSGWVADTKNVTPTALAQTGTTTTKGGLPVTGPEHIIAVGAMSLAVVIFGFFLFAL